MKMPSGIRAPQLTRRDFLSRILAGALLVPRWPGFVLPDVPQFPFEEIRPEKSGIRWVHSNGNSPEKYLPETSGAGCAFLDYDNDGWMDVYLVNSGKCDFFTPNPPLRNALYRNNRDGTFTDVSKESGIASHPGKVWGVVATDINNDGLIDLWVSNDTVPNFLFVNRGKGKFDEIATTAGVAYSDRGRARSGMGVDSADFSDDGWMGLFGSKLDGEMFARYKKDQDATF